MNGLAVWTIGHSTHPIDEFIAMLSAHDVDAIVDVRRYPASSRYPQFNEHELRRSLAASGITYRHALDLGGRRSAAKTSHHTAWRSASFRAYADHMETPAFQHELETLVDDSASMHQAIMCAEAVPWRCHRQLIADALTAIGIEVRHILSTTKAGVHTLTPFAHVMADGMVLYAEADHPNDGDR